MNIIDAIKSGKPFQRPDYGDVWFKDAAAWAKKMRGMDDWMGVNWHDAILADDYVVLDEPTSHSR